MLLDVYQMAWTKCGTMGLATNNREVGCRSGNNLKPTYGDVSPPDFVQVAEAHNIEMFGNPLGSTVDRLRQKGLTGQQITNWATRPGGQDIGAWEMKADLRVSSTGFVCIVLAIPVSWHEVDDEAQEILFYAQRTGHFCHCCILITNIIVYEEWPQGLYLCNA